MPQNPLGNAGVGKATTILLALMVACVMFAGCLREETATPRDGPVEGPNEEPPAVAEEWVHGPGGSPLNESVSDQPTFELRTLAGVRGWEPTIGITASGAIFLPSLGPAMEPLAAAMTHMHLFRSQNEGIDWEEITPLVLDQEFPPTMSADPYVFVDPVTDRLYVNELRPECNTLAWSDDEGESWEGNPAACGNPHEDHPTLWTGPGTAGARVLYLCSNQVATTTCKLSTDGGRTFRLGAPPFLDQSFVDVCSGGTTGHGMTRPGTATAFIARALNCESVSEVWIARTTDQALTWTSALIPAASAYGHDVHLAADGAGMVYALWIDRDSRRPVIIASQDDGLTWSEPVDVSFPDLDSASHAALTAGADGRLAWSYLATSTAADDEWRHYVGMSVDPWLNGSRFVTVDTAGRPLVQGWTAGEAYNGGVGDFLDIDLMPDGRVVASVVDVCQAACVDPGAGRIPSGVVGIVIQVAGPHPAPRASA
ncbi:MAG: sialidase family protein [Candidatus Thermoplasmatota archaeon]